MELLIIIPLCIVALIVVVGGYVYMFLNIMRSDPREIKYRRDMGLNNGLIPSK